MTRLVVLAAIAFVTAGVSTFANAADEHPSSTNTVVYTAAEIVTMTGKEGIGRSVAVRNGRIAGLGSFSALRRRFPNAVRDDTFAKSVLVPGLIDPHIHVILGGLMYAQPFAPPWPMATAEGMSEGYPTRESFLTRLADIVRAAPEDGSPVIVYGYHNLVQGDIDRRVLDQVTTRRPLIVWHYSAHDFYLNTAALDLIGATPALRDKFHGVDQTPQGELTGRLYEDAGFYVFDRLGAALFKPESVALGTGRYFAIMRRAGVTTTAELAYGAVGREAEDRLIAQSWSMERNAFRLFLVPEFRAFQREFGIGAPAAAAVADMVAGRRKTPAPVLPRVKFFTDAAYFSQTMRLSPPGYLSGQSKGSAGLWVIPPDRIAATLRPFMTAGLAAHIHSNGDAAQDASLDALAQLRADGLSQDFVIEHAGLFSPKQVARAAGLHAMISAASHYVHYLAGIYAEPLGPTRRRWISPLGSLSRAGMRVALHSDAPLAPPQPLRAAGVQITRATREGSVYEPEQALSHYAALKAITIDAAHVLGLGHEIGSIAVGKRADFTVLDRNPLRTKGADWAQIAVWGVVLEGKKRAIVQSGP